VPISRTASFTSYTSGGFGPRDQERLARELGALRARGVRAMLSNRDTPETRELYKDFFFERVLAPRSISRYSAKRQAVAELIVQTCTKQLLISNDDE
jgi:DNA adenine methylase